MNEEIMNDETDVDPCITLHLSECKDVVQFVLDIKPDIFSEDTKNQHSKVGVIQSVN